MKLSGLVFSLFLVAVVAAATEANTVNADELHEPFRITFQELDHLLDATEGDSTLRSNLNQVLENVGLFSITDIPGFARTKPDTLQHLVPCMEQTTASARHVFADGTRRDTLATIPGEPLLSGDINGEDCTKLLEQSRSFRETVDDTLQTVAAVLQSMANAEKQDLLKDVNGADTYNVQSMIVKGQHLEHFHVYSTTSSTVSAIPTLDWHTDQGLLLLFSPAIRLGEPSQRDFWIQLAEDEQRPVHFTPRDELVVMLGQGVSTLLNPFHDKAWRAVPHAVRVQPGLPPRAWYGRMVLPPATAIHPLLNDDQTFGELRNQQISMDTNTPAATLACGGRQLQDVTEDSCQPDAQHFCWHRCLNYTEVVSPEVCAAANASLEVACVNEERQLWTGAHDMSFGLACINVEEAEEAPMPEEDEQGEDEQGEDHEEGDHEDEDHDHGDEDHDHDHEEDMAEMSPSGSRQYGYIFVVLSAGLATLLAVV